MSWGQGFLLLAQTSSLLRDAGLEGRIEHVHELRVLGVGVGLGVSRRRAQPPVNLGVRTVPRAGDLVAREQVGQLRVLGEDDVLGDDAVEALDEAGVVSGEGGELRVHALPWGVLQQGLLLVSSETKTKYKYLTF